MKELHTIQDRLAQHNYTGDELKLNKYKVQLEKCDKDVESLSGQLESATGPNIIIVKKKLEMRKVDCAKVEKSIETTSLLLSGKTKLLHTQQDLEDKLSVIRKKIRHYEVCTLQPCVVMMFLTTGTTELQIHVNV